METRRRAAGGSSGRWIVVGLALAVGLVGLVIVLADGGDGDAAERDATATTTTAASTSPSSVDEPPTTPAGAGALGSVRVTGTPSSCPLEECTDVDVECPGLPPATATVAVEPATGTPDGVVVLLSGAEGKTFWANSDQGRQAKVVSDIAERGLDAVEVAWPDQGWAGAPAGEAIGFAALACRSATIVQWVHDERYVPMDLDPSTGACGFCVSGNSGGASQIAYSLAYYGLDVIIDAAVMTSGPPHAGIGQGCIPGAGESAFAYGRASLPSIDAAYGHPDDPGPCAQGDAGFADLWRADSVDTGGNDYVHPTTRIEFLLGGQDRTVAPAHARLYIDRLEVGGSPMVHEEEIPEMQHEVLAQTASRDAVIDAIFGAAT